MNLYLDIHALHTLPPSNINRDDTGAPKTAVFGGVLRQRVSSQAWKRSIRKDFEKHLGREKLGLRTRRIVSAVVEEIQALDSTWETARAEAAVEKALTTAGIALETPKKKKDSDEPARTAKDTKAPLFLSHIQIHRLAKALATGQWDELEPKKLKQALKDLVNTDHSVDIAAFGRMVAGAKDFNVDAAVQVAHAIGVAASEPEFDYFTTVDDVVEAAEETGAGMIGTVQMMSSTLYRYATVDLEGLEQNLGTKEATVEAAAAFVSAFISSMPTGKQNTFANRTLPEVVVVSLRPDRPISWVNAFEEALPADGEGNLRALAAKRLAEEAQGIDNVYGVPPEKSDEVAPVKSWVLALPALSGPLERLGERVNRSELLDQVRQTLEDQLEEHSEA